MHGMVKFADILHVKFRLCFASAVYVLTPRCTPFAYKLSLFDPSFSLSFALLQRLCFFGCLLIAIQMSKNSVSHQPKSPPAPDILQCPIVLVSSGLDDSSIPLLMFSIGIYILPSYILLSACCDIFCTLCFVSYNTVLYMCML